MEKIFSAVEAHWRQLLLGLLGMIVILLSLLGWLVTRGSSPENTADDDLYTEIVLGESEINEPAVESDAPAAQDNPPETTPQVIEVMVDVKGAVHYPGVYTLASDKRIVDAISHAGGLLESAESNAVNFAQVVADQMVIYVPEIGEETNHQPAASLPQSAGVHSETEETAKVNINTADSTALMTLKGIGSAKAENIINYREENGPFQTIEELKNVSGIGDATFGHLKNSVFVAP